MHIAIAQHGFINCQLFAAQRQDCKTVKDLWQSWPWHKIHYVVADRGYDSGDIRHFIKAHHAIPVIPPRGIYLLPDSTVTISDVYDTELYAKRHIIERFFGRIKENKRIAMRFDKLDMTFLSFIALAVIKLYKLFC
jgi:transposase